jgi:hypothetical protein
MQGWSELPTSLLIWVTAGHMLIHIKQLPALEILLQPSILCDLATLSRPIKEAETSSFHAEPARTEKHRWEIDAVAEPSTWSSTPSKVTEKVP